ncbi:MAG TPA: UbiA family prenyltransferase [Chthoniobacterales bacterium]
MIERGLFLLKASRPGLWFQTLWLYTLPLATSHRVGDAAFWLGFAFVLLPLNLLVYGWNDLVDRETDAINPRKDSYLFGARGTPAQLATLPLAIAAINAPFFLVFVILRGGIMAAILAGMVLTVALYNLPRHGLRGRPPLELLNQFGYLLILPFAIVLNDVPPLPWQSVAYLALFCTHAHLMGEIMDVTPDREAGRRTTATVLGIIPVKLICLVLVLAEAFLLWIVFRDHVLGTFLLLGAGWLVFDLFAFRDRSYSQSQFLLFGAGLNLSGFASMAWVWATGTLTRLP